MPRTLLLLLVTALLAAGCGDDDATVTPTTAAGPDATADPSPTAAPASVETGPVTVDGAPLPPWSPGDVDPAVGLAAPTVAGVDEDGDPVTVAAGEGPAMIMFAAHWCPHCQRELPRVADWVAGGGLPDGVDLYVVSTAVEPDRDNYPPSDWVRSVGPDVPTLMDGEDSTAAASYGLTSFPYWVVLDADGQVVFRIGGELDAVLGVPVDEALGQLAAAAQGA